MKIRNSMFALALFASAIAVSAQTRAQATPAAASAPTTIPALVPYSGIDTNASGSPFPGETHITFLIFKDEQGGEPLWSESQIATIDLTGHYKVQLGAANPNGLPSNLFATGEARWLEVQIAGQPEQPRVLLASVPYALKAADAATLGGLPASAFALAGASTAMNTALPTGITPDSATTVTTTGGTANKLAKFSGTNTIVNSIVYDNGTQVGIGTTTPSATLNVNGTLTVDGNSTYNGQLVLPATGTATASKGYSSQFVKLQTSAYNSSSKSVVPPRFQLQAEVTGNDTSAPNATLNLLSSATSSAPVETGFYLNTNGTIHFASGQIFDGVANAGTGIIGTSTSGSGVNGSSSSGSGILGTTAGSTLHTAGVYGVAGTGNSSGYSGIAGVWGDAKAHVAVLGTSTQYEGVQGFSAQSNGVYGQTDASSGSVAGVYGYSSDNLPGVRGESLYSSGGYFSGGNQTEASNQTGGDGVTAYGGDGFYGGAALTAYGGVGDYSGTAIVAYGANNSDDSGDGIQAVGGNGSNQYTTGAGIYAVAGTISGGGTAYAGSFNGNVTITGTLSAAAKNFQIDHPLDPGNKYLNHTSIESSEMMNIYSGNVTTDELGMAVVALPSWFQSLNTDFRYQLTVLGGRFAQAIVSKEIEKNQFTISTNATGVKDSWQVTGVRQDAYSKAHPLVVEEAKPTVERGFYLHPELYGQPKEKQTEWGRHPGAMARLQARRETRKTVSAASHPMVAQTQTANAPR